MREVIGIAGVLIALAVFGIPVLILIVLFGYIIKGNN